MSGRYSNCKHINRLVRGLIKEGWTVETTSTHPRVIAPNGQFITFSLTPSDGNAHRAFERDVRRLKHTLTNTKEQ